MTPGAASGPRHSAIWLAAALCAGVVGHGIHDATAQEFRVAAIRDFGQIFSPASDPGIEKAFRGALQLRWDRKRFRGFSGLHINPDGRLTAISDRGAWLELALVTRDGFLVGANHPVLKRLRGPGGDKLKREDGDAEAMAPDGHGGFVIAFERRARLLHYPAWRKDFLRPPRPIAPPAGFAALSANNGVEALARLCDGRLLALAQSAGRSAPDAWVGGAGGWTGRRYARSGGFVPTGAATLPDCSVAVLQRRTEGARDHSLLIGRLPSAAFGTGSTGVLQPSALFGPVVGRALKFEGIAVREAPSGGILVYLISDSGVRAGTTLVAFALGAAAGR